MAKSSFSLKPQILEKYGKKRQRNNSPLLKTPKALKVRRQKKKILTLPENAIPRKNAKLNAFLKTDKKCQL